jgi:hypothetical protein
LEKEHSRTNAAIDDNRQNQVIKLNANLAGLRQEKDADI